MKGYPCRDCDVIFTIEVFLAGHLHGWTQCPNCLHSVHSFAVAGHSYCGRCNRERKP